MLTWNGYYLHCYIENPARKETIIAKECMHGAVTPRTDSNTILFYYMYFKLLVFVYHRVIFSNWPLTVFQSESLIHLLVWSKMTTMSDSFEFKLAIGDK